MKTTFNILTLWGNANQTTLRFYFMPARKAITKKTNTTKAGKDADKRKSCTLLVGIETSMDSMEIHMQVPPCIKTRTSMWSSSLFKEFKFIWLGQYTDFLAYCIPHHSHSVVVLHFNFCLYPLGLNNVCVY
jgi:hypothetical protein